MAGTSAGPPAPGTTDGSPGHRPEAGRGAIARAPALSVSHPSAGQVSAWTACTTRFPSDPAPASRQSAGVAVADMSLHNSPGIPTKTTGCPAARSRTGAAALTGVAPCPGPASAAVTPATPSSAPATRLPQSPTLTLALCIRQRYPPPVREVPAQDSKERTNRTPARSPDREPEHSDGGVPGTHVASRRGESNP